MDDERTEDLAEGCETRTPPVSADLSAITTDGEPEPPTLYTGANPLRRRRHATQRDRWDRDTMRRQEQFWRARDTKANEVGRLPEGEHLQLAGLLLVELFGPSMITNLLEGIRAVHISPFATPGRDPIEWINRTRGRTSEAFTGLGMWRPPGRSAVAASGVVALPPGVIAVFPTLHAVANGVTALAVHFAFDDDHASSVGQALQADYETQFVPQAAERPRRTRSSRDSGFGYSIKTPDILRREAAERALTILGDACGSWMKDHFPGSFAASAGGQLPGARFLVTELAEPLKAAGALPGSAGLGAVGLAGSPLAWSFPEWPPARLRLPGGFYDGHSRSLTVAVRRSDALVGRPGFPDDTNWSIGQYAAELVSGLTVRWSMIEVLAAYRERTALLRDSIARPASGRPIRDIRLRRQLLAADALDSATVRARITELARDPDRFAWNVIEPVRTVGKEPTTEQLLELMRSNLLEQAELFEREQQLVMQTLTADSELAGVISSIRVQRIALVVSLIALLVALWVAVGAN